MTWLPLNPIPLKDRVSMIFLQYGQIDVIDGAFVLIEPPRESWRLNFLRKR